MAVPPSPRDRLLGCLVGGAIGDCRGGVAERGRLCLSDDTQLTLATAEAMLPAGRVDPEAVAASFLAWFRARRLTGLGSSTLKALRDLEAGAHWALSGARGERAAGNGAAMRAAPLAFVLDPTEARDRQVIRDVSRITHHHDEAYAGALAVVGVIRLATRGGTPGPGEWLASAAALLPDCRVRDRLSEVGASGDLSPAVVAARFGSSGYVVDTVPLALVGAETMTRDDFGEQLAVLVSASADADTIASIAGQVAGAALGIGAVPRELQAMVPELDEVIRVGDALARALAG